jgi:hypothetical protein
LIISGAPSLRLVDSADGICARTTGEATILCRGVGLVAITKTNLLLKLPYFKVLDDIAMSGTTQTALQTIADPLSQPPPPPSDLPSMAAADDTACVALKTDRVYRYDGLPAAIVTVTNNCSKGFGMIGVSCTWLKAGAAVATAMSAVTNLSPGQTESERVYTGENVAFDSARSRVAYAI